MDTKIVAALISAGITFLGVVVAFWRWRRDIQVKLENLRDDVTLELIKQRFKVYAPFFCELEKMSTFHRKKIENNPKLTIDFVNTFQDAIYGPVGLFASSDTRQIMVYARLGCKLYADGDITYAEWLQRIWSVHLAIRSDLGIIQPQWSSEIDRVRKRAVAQSSQSVVEQVEATKHLKYS